MNFVAPVDLNSEAGRPGQPAISDFALNSTGQKKRRAAFTLLELMISITIFSMVLAAIYSSWSAILRASKAGHIAAAEAQRSRMTLRALEESLGATQLFLENVRYYWFFADTSGDFASLSFVSHLPPSFPGSGLFGDQVVRRVSFSVEPGKNGQNQLLLQQSPVLESSTAGDDPYTIVLAPNVREFKLFFFDTNVWDWVDEWLWTNRLPRMVRAQVAFGEAQQGAQVNDDVAIKTIYLASVAIPREAQVPPGRGGVGRPGQPGGRTNAPLQGPAVRLENGQPVGRTVPAPGNNPGGASRFRSGGGR